MAWGGPQQRLGAPHVHRKSFRHVCAAAGEPLESNRGLNTVVVVRSLPPMLNHLLEQPALQRLTWTNCGRLAGKVPHRDWSWADRPRGGGPLQTSQMFLFEPALPGGSLYLSSPVCSVSVVQRHFYSGTSAVRIAEYVLAGQRNPLDVLPLVVSIIFLAHCLGCLHRDMGACVFGERNPFVALLS
eukprot:jgi/Botrbrau1/23648/Bobra.55_2s0034.1